MQIHYHKIFGNRLRVYSWGNASKPLLVLVHGWLDTGASFHFLAEKLKKKFFCVAPDMRGFGKSAHGKSPLGYFVMEYVADLKALIDQLAPRRSYYLLGHSLGGAVASLHAASFAERLKAFVNVEGLVFKKRAGRGPEERLRQWMKKVEGAQSFPIHASLPAFAERLQQKYPRFSPERALFFAKYLAKKVPGGYQMAADPKHKMPEPYTLLPQVYYRYWQAIKVPSLFVVAEKSEMAAWAKGSWKSFIRAQSKYFPSQSELLWIPDCGHMIPHERPEFLAERLLEFFAHRRFKGKT